MKRHSRFWPALAGLILILGVSPTLRAQSPPLITDDPGTPAKGHWELNVGISGEQRPGERLYELPLFDFNYGLTDRVQLKYEIPYLRLSEDGVAPESGFGNSEIGVKWRFYDAGEKGLSISVYPQYEFNHPRSTAADRGLVAHGSAILLPFQFQKEVGQFTFVWQVGHEFRRDDDAWFYGLAVCRNVTEKICVGVELAGGSASKLERSELTANLGVTLELNEGTSLMFSVGRELHNHNEPKATLIGYVGMQWRL